MIVMSIWSKSITNTSVSMKNQILDHKAINILHNAKRWAIAVKKKPRASNSSNGTSVLPLSGNLRYVPARSATKPAIELTWFQHQNWPQRLPLCCQRQSDRTNGKTLFWSSVVKNVFGLTDAIFVENAKKIRAIRKQHLLIVRFVIQRDCIAYFKQHILV